MDQHCYFKRPLSNFEDGGTSVSSTPSPSIEIILLICFFTKKYSNYLNIKNLSHRIFRSSGNTVSNFSLNSFGSRYMTSNTNDPQNQPTIDPYAAPGMATNNSVRNNTFELLKGKGEYEREREIRKEKGIRKGKGNTKGSGFWSIPHNANLVVLFYETRRYSFSSKSGKELSLTF
ncbi:unnamed protein product [Rhizophagus irregularis]|nr:unnamed protein product [Rhizophagus irregularis]